MIEANNIERTVNTGARMTEVEKLTLERASEQLHMSQSSFIRYAIFSTIDRMDKQREEGTL